MFCLDVRLLFLMLCLGTSFIAAEVNASLPWSLLPGTSLPYPRQMSGVTQLGPFVVLVGGCEDFSCENFSRDIILYDIPQQRVWIPTTATWNATGGKYTLARDRNAVLAEPVAGLHSAVSIKGSVFVMGPCNMIPRSYSSNQFKRELSTQEKYSSVQRIILADPGDGESVAPSVEVIPDYADLGIESARVNASCCAHGTSNIYIVGGIAINQITNQSEFTSSVTRVSINVTLLTDPNPKIYRQSFELPRGVVNPSIVSDAETIYIVGGVDSRGLDTTDVSVYYAPAQVFLARFTNYRPIHHLHNSPVTHSTVIGGNIVVGGDTYRTFEAFALRFPDRGWDIVVNTALPLRNSTTWAIPTEGEMLLLMFGGHTFDTKEVVDQVHQTVLPLPDSPLAGSLRPQQDLELTTDWQDVPILHWNETVEVVFNVNMSSVLDACNQSIPAHACTLRLSPSSRCDISYQQYSINTNDLRPDSESDSTQRILSPGLQLPAEPQEDRNEITFLYACFSPGVTYQPPSCVQDPQHCLYDSRFYTAMNAGKPSLITKRELHQTKTLSASISALPVPNSPKDWTTKKTVIVSIVGIVVILILIGSIRYCCWQGNSFPERRKGSLTDPLAASGSRVARGDTGHLLGEGRYRTLERLGKGSFSVVYLVQRLADGKSFALKYIQCPDENERREAMKECEVIAKLRNHPNVIHLEDMFLSYKFDPLPGNPSSPAVSDRTPLRRSGSGLSYQDHHTHINEHNTRASRSSDRPSVGAPERFLSLVMEYHEQGDLAKWVRRKKSLKERIPEATIVSVAHQVCSVLHYMHTHQPPILHRDLKPENLLLSSVCYNNVADTFLPIVISDFGLSRVMDKAFCETGVGSLPYVAPECWKRHYTTKIDIWATGCILFAMCARRVDADNVVVMFSESNRPNFKSFVFNSVVKTYGYSKNLAHFITMMLEVDHKKRLSADQCLDCIKRRVLSSTTTDTQGSPSHENEKNIPQGISRQDSSSIPALTDSIQSRSRDSIGALRFSNTAHERAAALEHYLIDIDQQEDVKSLSKKTGVRLSTEVLSATNTPVKKTPSKKKRATGDNLQVPGPPVDHSPAKTKSLNESEFSD